MAKHPFIEVLDELLLVVANKQGVVIHGRNKYYLLKGFTRRQGRYFPNDPLVAAKYPMPLDEFKTLRNTLAAARGADDRVCLSKKDLERLDNAFDAYQTAVQLPISRSGEYIPKLFDRLVRQFITDKEQLGNIKQFRVFLGRAVMTPFWKGEIEETKENSSAIRKALLNKSSYFKVTDEQREALDDVLLGICAFCAMLQGDGLRNSYTSILIDRQKRQRSCYREQELLQLTHFHDPKQCTASKSLEALEEGLAGIYGELEGPFMQVRAAASAIECGFDLLDTPAMLHGYSAEELMRKGIDSLGEAASLQSRLNCDAFALRAHAMKGRLDCVLGGAIEIRAKCKEEGVGPHLEAMLSLNEAIAYVEVSKGEKGPYLKAACYKVSEVKRLSQKLAVSSLWEFDQKHIERMERICVDKFGSLERF